MFLRPWTLAAGRRRFCRARLGESLHAGLPCAACGAAAFGAILLVLGSSNADDSGPHSELESSGFGQAVRSTDTARLGNAPAPGRDAGSRQLDGAAAAASRFSRLPALHFVNLNTHASLDTRLYEASGAVDEHAAVALDALLGDMRDRDHPRFARLDRRTLQLVYRAAYHFQAGTVEVVSAYRAPRVPNAPGPHATGRAIDFRLSGVAAATLAAYLRKTPRAGIGVYTHRRTQYVHLDTRDVSHHWLDASPPGKKWRELSLGPRSMTEHDARYRREEDWPEGTSP